MRVLIILAGLAVATAAVAQDDRGWTWEPPAVQDGAKPDDTAPGSVLDRLQHSKPEAPATEQQRRQKWLQKFESRGGGGTGGEGAGDAAGGGDHG